MPKFNAKKLDDYQPPKSDRPDFTDGEYQVKGVKFFRDKNDNPILRLFGDKLRIGINYILDDGSIGPFGTMELYKVNVLQNAFNKEAQFQVPPDESDAKEVATFLKQVEYNINAAGNTITLTVANGYAAYVSGQQVPANCEYNLKVVDVLTKNDSGEPIYVDGKWYEQFQIQLEIQPGKFGNPFAGCGFKCWIPYGFKIVDGDIRWTVDKDGSRSTSSKVAHAFYKLTAPEMFENDFTADDDNLVKYWYSFAKMPSNTFKVYVRGNTGKFGETYYNPQWFKAELVEEEEKPDIPDDFFETAKKAIEDEPKDEPVLIDKDTQSRNLFVKMLAELARVESVAGDDYELNESGKEVAGKYLTPLLKQNKIQQMKIRDMTIDYSIQVTEELLKSINDEFEKHIVALYLEKMTELNNGGEFGNTFDTGDSTW